MPPILPHRIACLLGKRTLTKDSIGLSSAGVYLAEDMVLKIGAPPHEADMLRLLAGQLPVSELLAWEEAQGQSYLLMTRLPGKMLCDESFLQRPELLTQRLCEAFALLWSLDIASLPCPAMTKRKLALARARVEQGLCDVTQAEADTYAPGAFASPEDLLHWLEQHRPEERLCLSHGDLCLPNILADEHGICGFVDLGFCGAADPWQDLALAYRSLLSNLRGEYGGPCRSTAPAKELFSALGISPDPAKLRWYLLLDELF